MVTITLVETFLLPFLNFLYFEHLPKHTTKQIAIIFVSIKNGLKNDPDLKFFALTVPKEKVSRI